MRIRLSLLSLLSFALLAVRAQSVITVRIEQHPVLSVIADDVQVELGQDRLTLGSGISVTGGDGAYRYEWTDGNGDVLGTSPAIEVSAIGDYFLQVSDGSQCTVSVKFTVTASTVIERVSEEMFSVDCRDRVLNIASPCPVKQVLVMSASGILVKQTKPSTGADRLSITLDGIPQGVYIIGCVFTDGREYAKQIVIK